MWMSVLLASSLLGAVIDEEHNPIEGTVVALIPLAYGAEAKTGMSDAQGRFEIAVPETGALRVEAYCQGYVPFKASGVDFKRPLSIVLTRGGETLEGVVRDGDTLDPVEGAVIETRTGETWVRSEPRLGLVEAVSDERGEFRLEGLSKRSYYVSASAPGYGRAARMDVAPGTRIELYLFPGSGIHGRILDEKGNPVGGALIAAEGSEGISFSSSAQKSDAEGRFAFLGLEPGTYRLFARGEDLAPAAREIELTKDVDVEVELVLTKGVTVTGRLLDEVDEPVTGRVSLRSLDGFGATAMIRARMKAESDAEGFFSLAAVPPGDHTLLAEARGYGAENVEVLVSGKTEEQDLGDIVLDPGLSLSGRVLDEGGSPIGFSAVSAVQPARGVMSSTGDLFAVAEADEQGRFVLAGLSPGAHHLTAAAPGFGQSERVAAEPGAANVVLTLRPTGSIQGTVVDPEGRPVASFRAMARSSERREAGRITARGAAGSFVLEEVVEGEYAVEIVSPDFLSEAISSVSVSAGSASDVGTLRLRRGGSIAGTVVDSSAEPVPGATIGTIVPGPRIHQERTVSSDPQGRFRIPGLLDGEIAIEASHPSYAETRLDGVVVDSTAGASEVEIVLRRGGALEGVVRTRDGSDVAGRTIQVFRHITSRNWQTVRTTEDGSFRIEHLPAGKLTAALQQVDGDGMHTVQSREVEIAEGETTYVEFQPRSVLVRGQVKRGGTPLSGVEIELQPNGIGFSASYSALPRVGAPTAGPRFLMGLTGEDGYYELFVGDPGEYHVSAAAHGIGLPWRTVTIPDADSYTLDLDFGGALVSGRVVDKDTEAPVAGAFVSASALGPFGSESGVESGPDGHFELDLEPGEFALVVRAGGYARKEEKLVLEEGGRSDLVIALSSGLRITGRVVDANDRAVGGIQVMAVEDSPDVSAVPTRVGQALTISDGSFGLEDLARGRYNILAASGDAARFSFLPSIPAGADELVLVLRPGGKVEGLVVDVEGVPVANAIVALAAIDGRKIRGVQSRTDGSGRLALKAPQGNLTLKAVRDEAEGMATVAVSENATARVAVTLAQAASSLSKK